MPEHAGFRERKYRLAESEMRGCDPTSSVLIIGGDRELGQA